MSTPLKSSEKEKKKRQTPYGNRRSSSSGCFAPFKSPATKKLSNVASVETDKVTLAKEVLALKKQIEEKDVEIAELSENYCESELQDHIDKLHTYNEIKDIAQMIIGKLAEQNGTTTKEVYADFQLDVDD